jgi:hypothetical protein
MYKLLVKYNNFITTGLKLLFSLTAVYFLWHQKYLQWFVDGNYPAVRIELVFVVVLLGFVNWFLEIKKWQKLATSVQSVSLNEAFHQSLTAFVFSLLTPNRIGEFGAKALFYENKYQKKILSLSVLGAFTQMSVSLIVGGITLSILSGKIHLENLFPAIHIIDLSIVLPISFLLVSVLLFKYLKRKFHFDFDIWQVSFKYSILRYVVFSTQFVLLLHFFMPDISFRLLYSLVFLTYFLAALIPVFSFLDWAVKSSVAVWTASLLKIYSPLIIKAVGLIWFLNFFVPFLIGWWLILQQKSFLK